MIASLLFAAALAASPADDVPLGPLPRSVVPTHYRLDLRMDPAADAFSGSVAIDVEVTEGVDTLWLHGRGLEIESASIVADGETLPLKASVGDAAAGVLRLVAPATLPVGKARVSLRYRAKYNQQLEGAYQIKVRDDAYIATQMEPLGARNAFPAFDEPAFKTPWDVSLTVPDGQVAIANTAQVGIDKVEDGWKKLRFATTEALPSYLIAFAVGPWDVVDGPDIPPNAVRTTPLKLRGIAPKGRGGELRYALDNTAAQLAALEEFFASPYPFDKLDILAAPDFSFGAMENAGLIVYHESLLLGIDTAAADVRQGYWVTHTHELAHQWFGNLVTMPWWDDLWLNEAFAQWMEARILRELKPELGITRDLLEGALYAMEGDSLASARRIHEPVPDYTSVASAFDGITYLKGAAVLSMFEAYVGAGPFRDAIRSHIAKFARGSATSGDLVRAIAAQAKDPAALQAAFTSFTDQAGVPLLQADLRCAGDEASVDLRQRRYLPLGSTASADVTWGIPVCLRFPHGDGTRRQCTLLSAPQATLALDTDRCPAWLHPNADGAGYYRFALAADDQATLATAFDSLGAAEQRVHADSLAAAYDSGLLASEAYLAAVPALARAHDRNVALAPDATLRWMLKHLASEENTYVALQRFIVATYQPRLDALGLDATPADSDERRLERAALLDLLADLPPATAIRTALARRGRRFLGLDGDGHLQRDALQSDERAIALRVTAELGGEAEFEAIVRHLEREEDLLLRDELLTALGYFTAPPLVERARALALSSALRSSEVISVPMAQLRVPTLRDGTRAWLRANFEALFAKVPSTWTTYLPTLAYWNACSTAEADAMQAAFAERMQAVEGGALSLTQAVEDVRLCAAKKAHHVAAGFGNALR